MKKSTEKLTRFLAEHRKLITFLAFALICAVTISPFLLCKTSPICDEKTPKILLSLYISQIVSSILVAIGVFIALWQYYIMFRSETTKLDKERIEKAIKLAQFYKDEVLTNYAVVRYVYEKVGIYNSLQKEKSRMIRLDYAEFDEIFGSSGDSEIKKLLRSDKLSEAIINISKVYSLPFCKDLDNIKSEDIIVNFRRTYITTLLNNAEYFAMYFTHGVADESVVFQSLYPSYIEMCRTLYYDIATSSPEGAPKLFRNLQGLYLTWVKKSDEIKGKMAELEDNPGTILELMR